MADANKDEIVASESCTLKKRYVKRNDSWSKEPVLFQCSHKDYFKKDAKLSAIHRILEMVDKPGKQQQILIFFFYI